MSEPAQEQVEEDAPTKGFNEFLAEHIWSGLNINLRFDKTLTIETVTHWLEFHGAGSPDVPLMQERVRDDASVWSASASHAELETYVAAGIMALDRSALTERAAKRLTALGWKNMSAESQTAFKAWIDKENTNG